MVLFAVMDMPSSSGENSQSRQNENQWSDDDDFESRPLMGSKSPNTKSYVEESHKSLNIITLRVGAQFNSFRQLEASIADFQKKNYCMFYNRDNVTIQQSRKKGVSRYIDPGLKYYWVKFCCIHGGKKFKSKSTGIRSSSTFQNQCPAFFSFNVSANGANLNLTKMNVQHNHLCSEKLYAHLPQVRGMTSIEKEKVAQLLDLGANKKQVRHKIAQESDKRVLLKDLSNVMARKPGQNNLQRTVETLQKKFGAQSYIYEEEGEMKGLFFVTEGMKRSMKSYPEFVGIDATFKLLDIRAPIYIMIVEDSEGSTEIVAVCILISEDKESMIWLLQSFKKVHPSWTKIRSIMADKDLLERQVIKQEFPSANVLICIFHSLRTFNREISCDKLAITPGQRDTAKEIFQKMVYASTEAEYMRYYEECQKLPVAILNYFDVNWHNIRNEWTLSKDFMQSTFLNTTNNRVESLNAKTKSVVKLYSTLEEFIEKFFVLVDCLSSQRDYKAAYNYQKKLVVPYEKNSPEWLYSNFLTRFAFVFVQREMTCFRRGKLIVTEENGEQFQFQFRGSRVLASSRSCDCPAFSSMSLPCRHIFAVRERLGDDLFDGSICSQRWTREYYCATQRVFDDEETGNIDFPQPQVSTKIPKCHILSQNERYRKAFVVTKELAGLVSEVTGDVFLERMKQLNEIRRAWVENREVSVSSKSVNQSEKERNVEINEARDTLADSIDRQANFASTPITGIDTIIEVVIPDTDAANMMNKTAFTCAKLVNRFEKEINVTVNEETRDTLVDPIDTRTNLASTVIPSSDSEVVSSTPVSSCLEPDVHFDERFNISSGDDIFQDECEIHAENKTPDVISEETRDTLVDAPNTTTNFASTSIAGIDINVDAEHTVAINAERDTTLGRVDAAVCTSSDKREIDLSKIRVPCALKRKGRPKGSQKTIIGLTKKRKTATVVRKLPFSKLRSEEKALLILQWLVEKNIALLAVNRGVVIKKESVETRPDKVTDSLIDDDVNACFVEKYFSADAWKLVKQILSYKKANGTFLCAKCSIDLDHTVDEGTILTEHKYSIRCDYCMLWYHLSCASLRAPPKAKFWRCKNC